MSEHLVLHLLVDLLSLSHSQQLMSVAEREAVKETQSLCCFVSSLTQEIQYEVSQ